MAWKSSGSFGELTGYPALLFVELKDWGRNQQTYMECLRSLHKMYSHLNAKCPDFKLEGKNIDDFEKGLASIDERMKKLIKLYNPDFEDTKTYPTGEDVFNIELFGVYTEIDALIAMSHAIDNQRLTEFKVPGGLGD